MILWLLPLSLFILPPVMVWLTTRQRPRYRSVNDAVVVLIDLSLTEDEEGIEDYRPPAITTSFEVDQE